MIFDNDAWEVVPYEVWVKLPIGQRASIWMGTPDATPSAVHTYLRRKQPSVLESATIGTWVQNEAGNLAILRDTSDVPWFVTTVAAASLAAWADWQDVLWMEENGPWRRVKFVPDDDA